MGGFELPTDFTEFLENRGPIIPLTKFIQELRDELGIGATKAELDRLNTIIQEQAEKIKILEKKLTEQREQTIKPHWLEALKVASISRRRYLKFHGRLRNSLIERGWISDDGYLTESGLKVIREE